MLLGKQHSPRMKKNALQSKAPGEKLTELGNSHWNVRWPQLHPPQLALGQSLIRNFTRAGRLPLSRKAGVVLVGRK